MEHLEWFAQAQNSDCTDARPKLSDADRELFDAASRGDHCRLQRLLQDPKEHANPATRVNGFNDR